MTWWPPGDVLQFCQKAGWQGEQARQAAAVALASSNGADHHHWCPTDTPGVDQRGLFGLDVQRVDLDEPHTLFDPHANAQAAYGLWAHFGKSWQWHPVYAATNGAAVRAFLLALDTDQGWRSKPGPFFNRTRGIRVPNGLGELPRPSPRTAGDQTPAEQEALWQPTTQ